MSILDRFFHSRDKPKNQIAINGDFAEPFFFRRSITGEKVNERTAMQTAAVHACVRCLAETIASLPIHVFEYSSNGKIKAVNHPLYKIIHSAPNKEMTAYVYFETVMVHLLLWGNSYSQIIRNGKGEVVSLYPLLPDLMAVSRDSKTHELLYTYQADTGRVQLTRKEILHISGLGFDGIIGYSPIALAANAVGMAVSAEKYGGTLYANGNNLMGILEVDGVLDKTKRDNISAAWEQNYGGGHGVGKTAILEKGVSFKPLAMSLPPAQSQFLKAREYQLEEIARIFRVPLHLVGDLSHATFSNVEHMSLDFVKFTLTPWVARIEQAIENTLLSEEAQAKYQIAFNLDGLMRGDYQSRMDGYTKGLQNGFLSPNDIRRLEDLNLIPNEQGGDEYIVNGNMVKLKDVGAAYANNSQKGDTSE
jgi:HK97 family phage portal protein